MSALVFLLAAVAVAVAWLARQVHLGLKRRNGPKLSFPVVGTPNAPDYSSAIVEGYRKYPNSPFVLPLSPPLVILPMSVYLESKNHPAGSLNAETYERFLGRYTNVGRSNGEVFPTIRQDLTKGIAEILPLIQDETRYAFSKEIGTPADWRPVPLYPLMLRLVALLSGRVFVGYPLNRNEEWLDASINYTTSVAAVGHATMTANPVGAQLLGRFWPSVRKAQMYLNKARVWMEPLVHEVMSQHKEKDGPVKIGSPGTFISWLLKYLPDEYKTPERIGTDQMLISFAAIHTTSSTGTTAVLDLLSRPSYIPALREEIETVLAEDGEQLDGDGHLYIPKTAFAKMKKLDSFIRESQRYSGLGFLTPARKAVEEMVFSDGTRVPKGARFSFPSYAVHMSNENPTLSPEFNAQVGNPGPEVFDGLRYVRMRQGQGQESKYQSVTTSLENLTFGHGPHACPGRFFAIYEIKMLLIELLRNYDMRLMGDTEGKGTEKKFRRVNMVGSMPDPRAMIEIRTRSA